MTKIDDALIEKLLEENGKLKANLAARDTLLLAQQTCLASSRFLVYKYSPGHHWLGSIDRHIANIKAVLGGEEPVNAGPADANGEPFALDQWWVTELENASISTPVTADLVRACKVAHNLAVAVLPVSAEPADPVVRDERAEFVGMVDAAMVEMSNIHPPLKRSECERLIRAALESKQ